MIQTALSYSYPRELGLETHVVGLARLDFCLLQCCGRSLLLLRGRLLNIAVFDRIICIFWEHWLRFLHLDHDHPVHLDRLRDLEMNRSLHEQR